MPFLERKLAPSGANFLWSSSQQEMAEEKSLACHADLDGRSQPSGALLQEEGRSHPRGDVPFVGTKGFRSQGREQQKGARQPSSTGAASHGKPHAHLFLFFFFCWEHRGTTKSLLCFRWLEEVLFAVRNCCLQGFAPGLRELRHHLGISGAWELLGEGISDFSRCEVCSQ